MAPPSPAPECGGSTNEAAMSLIESAKSRVREEARKKLAMLAASETAGTELERLNARLAAQGWKPTAHITADAIAGVGLVIWVNVASHARLAELLAQLATLEVQIARDDRLRLGDCVGYVLTLGDATRITLRVGITHASTQRAAA